MRLFRKKSVSKFNLRRVFKNDPFLFHEEQSLQFILVERAGFIFDGVF